MAEEPAMILRDVGELQAARDLDQDTGAESTLQSNTYRRVGARLSGHWPTAQQSGFGPRRRR